MLTMPTKSRAQLGGRMALKWVDLWILYGFVMFMMSCFWEKHREDEVFNRSLVSNVWT